MGTLSNLSDGERTSKKKKKTARAIHSDLNFSSWFSSYWGFNFNKFQTSPLWAIRSISAVPGKSVYLWGCGPSSSSWSFFKTAVQNNKRSTANPLPNVAPAQLHIQISPVTLPWLVLGDIGWYACLYLASLPSDGSDRQTLRWVLSMQVVSREIESIWQSWLHFAFTFLLWYMGWQLWSADADGYVIQKQRVLISFII